MLSQSRTDRRTAERTPLAPLPREQRTSAASVGRGRGWGLFLPFVCSKRPPTPYPSPQGGGERTEFAGDARSEGGRTGVSCFVLCALTMLSACSDLYYDRRETIALSADDHLNANRVEQMVDPWPYYVGNKNLPPPPPPIPAK
jgi:hypothetical protein